ncbi:MAG: cache domain-containing protein, partial [Deltaproteobacteria bacterium]
MIINRFHKLSLKSRVTMFTLLIFMISIWSLAYYASRMLHKSMERLISEQQFSTVSLVASEINEEFDNRLKSLKKIAQGISPTMLNNKSALQAYIEQRPLLQILFNAGVFVTSLDGTAVAEDPRIGRTGLNYMDRDHIAAALKDGKSTFGKPVIGKRVAAPSFAMTVPINDSQGKVIGALAGATDLSKPNFLNSITEAKYGKTGGYLLVAPQHRLVVTATDKKRVMTPASPPGANELIDRFMQGYEGSGILVNALGEAVLASAKRVPVAGWYVAASLPVAGAFTPIHDMQQQALIATLILTVFIGGLVWLVTSWMLRRQLAPMLAASRTLTTMSDSKQPIQPLSIRTNQDEIGELISGFNQLMKTLGQREEEISKSEAKFRLLFNNVPMSGVIWRLMRDEQQEIVDWELEEINQSGAADLKESPDNLIGKRASVLFSDEIMNPYLELCREVVASKQPKQIETFFAVTNKHYLTILFAIGTDHYVNVSFDITDRKHAEEALWNEKAFLRSLIDSSTDLIYFKDSNGLYLGCNKASEKFTGIPEKEQIGKTDFDFFDKELAEQIVMHDKDVLTGAVAVRLEELVTTADGSKLLLDT